MPKTRIVSGLALLALLSFSIQGCAFSTPENSGVVDVPHQKEDKLEEAATLEPVIEESGWCSVLGSANNPPSYQYSVVLKNPNENDIRNAVFKITGRDENGKMVFLQEEEIPLIAAGDYCMLGGTADGGIEARSIGFSVSGGLDVGVATSKASDLFVVEDAIENNGGPGGTSYSGVISARTALPEGCDKARVSVLLRDGSGALTAGYSTVIEVDQVAERFPFEILALGVPQHSSYEVSVSPWD